MIIEKYILQRISDGYYLGGGQRNIKWVQHLHQARTFTKKQFAKSSYKYNKWKPGSVQIRTLVCNMIMDKEILK